MTFTAPTRMSDPELLAETRRVVDVDRRTTAELLALLAEVESRNLYRGEGHSSLFTYCTHVLPLSESAAFSRIAAARAARRFPTILTRIANGDITLTTITRLASHLTDENHEALLDAARHKSKDDVKRLVAAIDPQPDVAASIRRQANRVPVPAQAVTDTAPLLEAAPNECNIAPAAPPVSAPAPALRRAPMPAVVAPLSQARYLVKFTASQETHDKLQRARDLLRHTVPNGDPAAIIDRALAVLIAQLEKAKLGAAARPRSGSQVGSGRACPATTRHVPAAVKRAVWARDEGRCAFVGTEGRCPETGFLEFHHVVPFAAGGATSVENLQLRCRSHNAHEAERFFGSRALSGQSSRAPVVVMGAARGARSTQTVTFASGP